MTDITILEDGTEVALPVPETWSDSDDDVDDDTEKQPIGAIEVEGVAEFTFEICPEDAETPVVNIFHSVALLPLQHVEWMGFTLEPLGFGISFVLATCRVPEIRDAPDQDVILEAVLGLDCVQTAKTRKSRTLDGSELDDPFDLCWRHPPKPFVGDLTGPSVKCGIVSTVRDALCLTSWLRFHIRMGFSRIWLYADAPSGDDISIFLAAQEAHPDIVTVVPRDAELRNGWQQLAGWKRYGPMADAVNDLSALIARQCLNGEHAACLAEAEGCEWLMHIDMDELACPASVDGTISQIFQHANSLGANAVVFPNHEVAPEIEGPYADPFQEATLFKVNERLRPPGEGTSRFLAYSNGKSAVRVGGGVRLSGAHKWIMHTPAVTLLSPENACVLHFVNCGFDALRVKYEILGAFDDKWCGRNIAASIPFHIAARDAAQGGRDALLSLYRERVMYDADKAAPLLDEGALIRINTAKEILQTF